MFFIEFLVFLYVVFLFIFLSFFIKEQYSSPVLSLSFNNFSQALLFVFIFFLSFSDNFNYVSVSSLFTKDFYSIFFQILLSFSVLMVVIVSKQYIAVRLSFQQEYELLIMMSFLGLLLLCFSSNLLVVYLAIELQSLAFYTLSALQKNSEFSGESGLKYFILGSFSSGFLLFAFANIYLFTSAWSFEAIQKITFLFMGDIPPFFLGLLMLLIAFLFKQGIFPFHFWICDVYEGSPLSVTMFFTIIPKTIIFCLFSKLFFQVFSLYYPFWSIITIFCGFFSIIVGNIGALYQKKLKRLLAFSAISHSGFILISFSCFSTFAIKAFVFYFVIYVLMSILLFSVVIISFSKQHFLKYLINWCDTAKKNFSLIFLFTVVLFSTAGIPPLSGFYSKLLVFTALIQQDWLVLTILVAFFSCVGCFYYIRLIKTFFFRSQNSVIWLTSRSKTTELIASFKGLLIMTLLAFPDFILYPIDLVCFLF